MRKPDSTESMGIVAIVDYMDNVIKNSEGIAISYRDEQPVIKTDTPDWFGQNHPLSRELAETTKRFVYAGSCSEPGTQATDSLYVFYGDELDKLLKKLGFQSGNEFITSPNYSIRAYNKVDGTLYACADMSTKISSNTTGSTPPPSASSPPGGSPPPTNTPKPSNSPWPGGPSGHNRGANWPKQSPTYNLMTSTGAPVGTVNLKSEGFLSFFFTKWTVAVRNLIKPADDARNMRVFVANTLCSQTPTDYGLIPYSLVYGTESTKSTMDKKIGKLLKAMMSDSPASVRLYFTSDSNNQPLSELLYACADYTTKIE